MAKEPKLQIDKDQGPFIGRVTSVLAGSKNDKQWRFAKMITAAPWPNTDQGPVEPGVEVIWFTPGGRDYDALVDGALVEIDRKGNKGAYRVTASGQEGSPAIKAATGRLNGRELKIVLYNALTITREVVEVYNGELTERMKAEGEDAREALDVLTLSGMEIEKIAVHLLMGSSHKSRYEIPTEFAAAEEQNDGE